MTPGSAAAIKNKFDELVFEYRNRRQDAIDAELLDIGAGFEAIMNQLGSR